MFKSVILFLFFMGSNVVFSQDFELRKTPFVPIQIIFKDSTQKIGLLRLASSVYDLRFKKDQESKESKINHNDVDSLIAHSGTDHMRIFQYMHQNQSKFRVFVELVYSDSISIYMSSSDSDDLFYADIDRQTINEAIIQSKYEGVLKSPEMRKDSITLPNGEKMYNPKKIQLINSRYNLYSISSNSHRNYLRIGKNPMLIAVENKKDFIKNAGTYFSKCPQILEALEQDTISLKDLKGFIEFYKMNCALDQPETP